MKRKYLIGGGVIIIAVGILLFALTSESSQYYQTVGEFYEELETNPDGFDKTVRITGYVVEKSIDWEARDLELSFDIEDENDTARLSVFYKGIMPENFISGSGVTVEGKYLEEGILEASNIIMKCPSKYSPEE